MKGVLVTGTDTGVGKTLVCGHLAAFLRASGVNATTQKWVETGLEGDSGDLETHMRICGESIPAAQDLLRLRRPYAFSFPASPHLAARLAGGVVDAKVIAAAFKTLCESHDLVIVEGAGGLLVPLNARLVLADLAAELGLAALVVAANGLGAINRTLLTLEAVRSRGIPLTGVVFNSFGAADDREILRDNPRIIASLSGAAILGEIGTLQDPLCAHREFEPIGRAFLARWEELSNA